MAPTLTPEQAFVQAVCEAPDDDAPRLIYADWLEERGDAESLLRAEFIRTQMALHAAPMISDVCRAAPTPCHRCADCMRWVALWERERELWKPEEVWKWIPQSLSAMVWWASIEGSPSTIHGDAEPPISCDWRRGFVEHVELTAADWLAHGRQLVRAAPLTSVRLTDKEPSESDGRVRWVLVDPGMRTRLRTTPLRPAELPRMWFDRLKGGKPGHWHYDTPDDAHADLSRVLLAWAHSTVPS